MIENKLYNPAGQSKEWLIEHFIVRSKVFEKIFKDIQSSKMTYPEQHYLIQGQRGAGKTTLLLRLKYEIENSTELNSWLLPVFFNEETYDVTTLSDLWEKLLKYCDEYWGTGGIYYKKTNEFLNTNDYEKRCFDYLLEVLKDKEKKIIIFFDNFSQLFLELLSEKEQHRLREILMTKSEIRIIGASANSVEDLYNYSKPFYEFFKIIRLEGLNKSETIELMQTLFRKSGKELDIKRSKAKIETLTILTGGVIRTLMLIYEVILGDEDGSALKDLEIILDRVTPLYKHIVEELPTQQRKIVDVIAKKWDAVKAHEVASNIRDNGKLMTSKTISAQLHQLEKNGIIDKKFTNSKNHLYQLKERFFNIWYLMRHGGDTDKRRVVWLTRFLESWYEEGDQLEEFIQNHVKRLKSGNYNPNSALIISEAIIHSKKMDIKFLDVLLNETSAILNSEQKKQLPDSYSIKLNFALKYFENFEYQKAASALEAIEDKSNMINIALAQTYISCRNFNSAKKAISKIVSEDTTEKFEIGKVYWGLKEFELSNKYLMEVVLDFPGEAHLAIASNFGAMGKVDMALEYYLLAIQTTNEAYEPLIDFCIDIEDYENATKYALEGISKGMQDLNKSLIEVYIGWGKEGEAQKLIDDFLNKYPEDPDFWHLLGTLRYFNGRFQEAYDNMMKANTLYISANVKNTYFALNNHLILDYLIQNGRSKQSALDIINEFDFDLPIVLLLKSIVYFWNNEYEKGNSAIQRFFDLELSEEDSKRELWAIEKALIILLAKGQSHLSFNIFNNEKWNLKDRMKPIYYALMTFLKDEHPNEILKMGEELKQPVEDVIARIKEYELKYK
ncbi:MAG TPA: hypothetical protein VK177_09350 [Flavobacteriales bacterium]|nr:hypothetical protein [Flavobacteriales bacterium]